MKRRALLSIGATASVGLLAGCTTDGTENPADDGSPPSSPSQSPSQSPSPSPSPSSSASATASPETSPSPTPASSRVTDTSFEAEDATCGSRTEKASVSTETTDGRYRVVVTGTTSTPTPCYTAQLKSVNFDPETGELTVKVVTIDPTEGGVCAQCIAEIDYEATVTFENGLPDSVTVSHDGEQVTTKEL